MGIQILKLSVSDTNQSVTFSPTVNKVTIKNSGTSICYININDVSTVDLFPLNPQDEIIIGLNGIETVQSICDTGNSTTIYINGENAYWQEI